MNLIPAFSFKAHMVFSTFWTMLSYFSAITLVDAKHIKPQNSDDTPSHHSRQRRNTWQFGNMVSCVSPWNSLDLADYGCYCGLGGIGQPKDEMDWCCYEHDQCWTEVVKNPECTGFSGPYTITYDWGCSASGAVHCYDADRTCDKDTCECDRKAAECFQRATYHPEYYNLNPIDNCNTTFVDNRFDIAEQSADGNGGSSLSHHATLTSSNYVFIALITAYVTSLLSRRGQQLHLSDVSSTVPPL